MIEETVFLALLFLAALFLIIGFFKHQYSLIILSGIVIMMSGALFLSGIKYVTSFTSTQLNTTVTTTAVNYTPYASTFKTPIFIALALIGLAIIFIGIFSFYTGGSDKQIVSDGVRDDEEE